LIGRRTLRDGLLTFVIACAFVTTAAAAKVEQSELIKAIAATMPVTHVDVPMQLSGEVTLAHSGEKITGNYTLIANSPREWREEIVFSNYKETHITIGGEMYVWRSAPVPDSAIMRAFGAMHEATYFRPSPEAKVRLRERKRGGTTLQCAEITEKGKIRDRETEVCFYPDTKLANSNVSGASYSFFDYTAVGTRSVPQHIVVTKDGETTADIRITAVTANASINTEAFAKPSNAREFPACEILSREELSSKVTPLYPSAARMARVQGWVVLYALVGADGRIAELRTLKAPSQELEASSVEAVRQWVYTPPMCGATPIPFETVITVNYSLRPN